MVFSDRTKGTLAGLIAAITYGLNPLFGKHLYQEGLDVPSVLFYRLLAASGMLALWMLFCGHTFRVPKRERPALAAAAVLLALTCYCWFRSFKVMDSGIAATLLFLYPVMVELILFFGFREKIFLPTAVGSAVALVGVAFLSLPFGGEMRVNVQGVIFVLISALAYAVYMVGLKVSRLKELSPATLTFYTLFGGALCFFFYLACGVDLQPIPSWKAFGNLMGVAFFPTFLSFLLLAVSIRYIGPTKAAVFGALEPLTAVVIGVSVLNEPMTTPLFVGMALILISVTLVISVRQKKQPASSVSSQK